ncbi:MAG: hypothetical protein NC548_29660 [Lachnospiraceae bacterium]|nr:hypothetical protein [Lachnospiraceae bacterium]
MNILQAFKKRVRRRTPTLSSVEMKLTEIEQDLDLVRLRIAELSSTNISESVVRLGLLPTALLDLLPEKMAESYRKRADQIYSVTDRSVLNEIMAFLYAYNTSAGTFDPYLMEALINKFKEADNEKGV